MFQMVLTTCFSGMLCYASQPDIAYVSAARCFQQGAIIAGFARANVDHIRLEQTSRIVCSDSNGVSQTIVLGREGAVDFPADVTSLPRIE